MLTRIEIDDDLSGQDHRAIEVTAHLADGTRRWCFFMTPSAVSACGDWIDGTTCRFHYGPHLIVVAGELTPELVEQALGHIDKQGHLRAVTLPLEGRRSSTQRERRHEDED
jgi:hypothetical protein